MIVLIATVVVAAFDLTAQGVKTVGDLSFGWPDVGFPSLTGSDVSLLLLPALGIFVVGYTDNVLTARLFASRHRHRVHNNQEFLALGAANLGSAMVSAVASLTIVAAPWLTPAPRMPAKPSRSSLVEITPGCSAYAASTVGSWAAARSSACIRLASFDCAYAA